MVEYMYVSYQILCWWIQCVSALQVFNKSLLVCPSSASVYVNQTTVHCQCHYPIHREYIKLVKREVAFAHSLPLNIVIIVVGWIYFAAWSISFYPQVHTYTHTCVYT